MKTEVFSIGRTGRTIVRKTYYKNIVHTVVLWIDGSSESMFKRINN